MRFSVAAAAALLGATSVSATNFTVKVGANNGVCRQVSLLRRNRINIIHVQLIFDPDTVMAANGDFINFQL